MDMNFFYGGIAIMLIIIIRDFLKKRYGFDSDKFDIKEALLKFKPVNKSVQVVRTTGTKSLVMIDAGANKATVMATLRQIIDLDYNSAKKIVESVPSQFLSNISDKEADLTKKALEFVGSKVEIRN